MFERAARFAIICQNHIRGFECLNEFMVFDLYNILFFKNDIYIIRYGISERQYDSG